MCDVTRLRFARLGWKNVHVVCQDARKFTLDTAEDVLARREGEKHIIKADYVSMSYSISMIPE